MPELPPIFVVNLRKDTNKREYMEKHLGGLGLEYEFIDAIDGTKLSDNELQQIYDEKLSQLHLGRQLVPGELGCYMSHVKIFEIIVKRNIPCALILEDDVEVSPDIVPFLKNMDKLPGNWEIVSLSELDREKHPDPQYWYRKTWKIYGEYEVGILNGELYGTQGYIIKKEVAEYCLSRAYPIIVPIDSWLFRVDTSILSFHSLKGKRLVREKEYHVFGSSIHDDREIASQALQYYNEGFDNSEKSLLSKFTIFMKYKVFSILYAMFLRAIAYFLPPSQRKPKPIYTRKQSGKIVERTLFVLALYYRLKVKIHTYARKKTPPDVPFPIFVISLKEDTKRREHISRVMSEIGLSFEFVDAVDGNRISDEELPKRYDSQTAEEILDRPLAKEEIGCYMSHVKAYQIISERDLPCALILEDDVEVSPNIAHFLENAQKIPGWEIINLSRLEDVIAPKRWHWKTIKVYEDCAIGNVHGEIHGAYGYMIKKDLAEYYASNAYPIVMPIDNKIFDIHYSASRVAALRSSWLVRHQGEFQSHLEHLREQLRVDTEVIKVPVIKRAYYTLWAVFLHTVALLLLPRKTYPDPITVRSKRRFRLDGLIFIFRLYFGWKRI